MIRYLTSLIIATGLLIVSTVQAHERIVTAGGSITEIIYALNAQDELVGVDMTSTYPEEVKTLPQIGYWKQLSIEGILSLKPSLFIAWQDSEPEMIFTQLKSAKVDVLQLQRVPNNVNLLQQNIKLIGEKLGKSQQAEQLNSQITTQLNDIEQKISHHSARPNVLFLFSMQGTTQISGKNTVADSVIELAGGHNVAMHNNYKNYSSEAFITANPDVIVVTTQSMDAIGGIENLAKFAGIIHTNAWKNQQIVVIDQSLILGMGPRVGEAVTLLYNGFYPTSN